MPYDKFLSIETSEQRGRIILFFFLGKACYRRCRTRQHLKTIRLMGNID